MGKQLNIRSDEAYDLAHQLARDSNMSVTRVVTEALRVLADKQDGPDDMFSDEAVTRREAALSDMIARQRKHLPTGETIDHSYLYDKNGLPK